MSKEEENFYIENGYRVLTEKFLVNRGWCCGNNCRHCPYDPMMKGCGNLKDDVKKNLTESKK